VNYKIEFKEQANQDIAEIVKWYSEQRDELDGIFLTELKLLAEQLQSNPYTFQIRRKNIRLGMFKRFPYIIAYQIEDKNVIIYSVTHQHSKKIYQRIKKK
jgi:mRNA-degrading endonuclease RelE of RelBE toxin-antitoxin system